MNGAKILGIVLIVAGVLALGYGGFSYTKETHDVKIGPIEMSVKEKESVDVPTWLGVGAIVAGALLILLGRKR
jgi:drug/metabolite transporter (DMT)-like permease